MAKDTVRTELGKAILSLRKEKRWSQQEVADLLNLKRDTYARYETDTEPAISVIKKICDLYNISCDALLCRNIPSYSELIKAKTPVRFSNYMAYNEENHDTVELTDSEIELIKRFRELSKEKQDALLIFIGE